MLSTQRTLRRTRQAVLAREAPGARGDVDRGRVGAPAHALGQLLRRDLRFVDRHPTRERNPQSIADQHRLDVLASTRPSYEFDLHVHHLYRVRETAQHTRLVNAPRTARGTDATCDERIRSANFRLTLAARGRSVRPYRFADASDSETRLRDRNGRTSGPGVTDCGPSLRGEAHGAGRPASRSGACEGMPGDSAPEGRPRGDRSCERSEDYSGPSRVRPRSRAPRVERVPSHRLCTVRSVRDALLDDLDPLQYDAVTSDAAPLAIIAPAGSGKTRVLTRRIAYRRPRRPRSTPRHVLAVTFTRKAAGELVSRIGRLGVDGPHHRGHVPRDRAGAAAPPRDRAQSARRRASSTARPGCSGRSCGERGAASSVAVADVAAEIEWAKARLIAPGRATRRRPSAAGRRPPAGAGEVAELYARYEAEKRTAAPARLRRRAQPVRRRDRARRGVRGRATLALPPPVRRRVPGRHAAPAPAPARVARRLEHDLTVVGDPAQAIYGFAGADAAPLIAFDRTFPGGQTIVLGRNYRSTPAVVALAEAALGGRGRRPAPPPRGGPRRRRGADDHRATTTTTPRRAPIADACWQHARGRRAVAPHGACCSARMRSRRASRPRSPAAACRSASARVSASRPAPPVRALLDELRDSGAEAAGPAVRAPPRRSRGRRRRAARATTHAAGDGRCAAADEARAHRDALLELGRDYLESVGGAGGVAEFTTWLDTATGWSRDQGEAGGAHGVDLVTFHRAKGLEWTVVFVTGLERGLVPISWATSAAAQAEERRLLHVALSRAEDELHCSWARARSVGTRRAPREPSPWLGTARERGEPRAARPAPGPARATRPPRRAARHAGGGVAREPAARTGPPAAPLTRAASAGNDAHDADRRVAEHGIAA